MLEGSNAFGKEGTLAIARCWMEDEPTRVANFDPERVDGESFEAGACREFNEGECRGCEVIDEQRTSL
jgi:hypothetical protein